MRNRVLIVMALLIAGSTLAWWMLQSEPLQAPAKMLDSPALPQTTLPAPTPDTIDTKKTVATEIEGPETVNRNEEILKSIYTEEQIEELRQQYNMKLAAERRFSETIELDNLQPEQVHPSIKNLFKTIQLEPVINTKNSREGYVDGMIIAKLVDRNPFAKAGFALGDQITSIDGQPLTDPAQIAHLFTALGETFEACAKRGDDLFCREIDAQ